MATASVLDDLNPLEHPSRSDPVKQGACDSHTSHRTIEALVDVWQQKKKSHNPLYNLEREREREREKAALPTVQNVHEGYMFKENTVEWHSEQKHRVREQTEPPYHRTQSMHNP